MAADTSVSVPVVPVAVGVPSSRAPARRAPVAIVHEVAAARAAHDSSESATPDNDASNRLREEATLLRDARAALKRGDPNVAGALLTDAERRFPAGRLAQEREALIVRVARASGERGRAILLARAFVEKYPASPLRASMQTLAREDEIQ